LNRFELRQADECDLSLTYEITREAMQDYVVQTWGVWVESEQREKHRVNFNPETHRIVLYQGAEVGLLAVEEEPGYLWLVKVYLKKEVQGNGIGTSLVRRVIEEASAHRKAVRLRVLRVNVRAVALYERLGFKVVGSEAERFFMVRPFSAA
jgi:ribosomal protein S18 acetylase RimI-like enzyme